ncbi:ParB N-terminal domain-containing protein [Sphingomonas sp.]|uniref:ParB/RepB/Spo0J family partition protein n=1 Tax=Sphingomonas sp. TaxID=28214 RepID=UPI0025F707E8|nr:ParB N-terminal domain-containing protein [Sphingomonas sp.]
MNLDFIALDKLCVSKANMRHSKKAPDVSDLLPTVRTRGVLQSLIVRPSGEPGQFEILAGARRYHAARIVAAETGTAPEACLLPCAILDPGDDAAAVEASLIENIARLDPDEVTQWETFTRLCREGRQVDEIAATFGLAEAAVRRVLALGSLVPRLRDLYRADRIDAASIRFLTMATKRQQQDWLALFDDPTAHAPTGHRLKDWLFGGQSIKAEFALFDIEASGLALVADLFASDRYVADPAAFWRAQDAAIEARRQAYLTEGWADVVILPPGDAFHSWQFDKTSKRRKGRVYIDVRATGEVVFHEGYLGRREAERAARGDGATPEARGEATRPTQTYVDLQRHAALKAALATSPQVALRLLIAHLVVGSPSVRVTPDRQAAPSPEIAQSVETSRGAVEFAWHRHAVADLVGVDPECERIVRGHGDEHDLVALFHRLLDLPDPAVLDVLAVVMAEGLASGSVAVEAAGRYLGLDMAEWWDADSAFLDTLRHREVLGAMVAEVAGAAVAAANAEEKAKTLRAILADSLNGSNGRAVSVPWAPRWMRFPATAYTGRGGIGSVRAGAIVDAALMTPVLDEGQTEEHRLAA